MWIKCLCTNFKWEEGADVEPYMLVTRYLGVASTAVSKIVATLLLHHVSYNIIGNVRSNWCRDPK